jgi:cytochrome c oxidase cbb3-type subunit 1
VQVHFGATALGVVLLTAGLTIAGWQQGHLLNDATVPFTDITKVLAFWFTFRSVGLIILLAGHLAFLVNFIWIACPFNSKGTAAAKFDAPPEMSLPAPAKAATEGHA